jgi:hypothetical protein
MARAQAKVKSSEQGAANPVVRCVHGVNEVKALRQKSSDSRR